MHPSPILRFRCVYGYLLALLGLVGLHPATLRAQELPIPYLSSAWRWQGHTPTGLNLMAVSAPTDSVAVVGGLLGTLLRTTTQGRTWQPLTLTGLAPPSSTIGQQIVEGVSFVTPRIGWTTAGGKLRRTTDGGVTWQTQPVQIPLFFPNTVSNPQFLSATTGYVFYQFTNNIASSGVARTTDGGLTWTKLTDPMFITGAPMQFTDVQHGWIAGDGVRRTTNGGLTWTNVTPTFTTSAYTQVCFVDALRGWVACTPTQGTGITAYSTTDGGQTWVPFVVGLDGAGQSVYLRALSRADALRGVAVTIPVRNAPPSAAPSLFSISRTTDGGQTWQVVATDSVPEEPRAAVMRPSGWGWIVGDRGMLLTTADFGATWRRSDRTLTDQPWSSVRTFGATHAWAAPYLASASDPVVVRTTRRGRPWRRHPFGLTPGLGPYVRSINASFPDQDTAYVLVGDQNPVTLLPQHQVVVTTDGGANWTPRPVGTILPQLRASIWFGPAGQGLFFGDAGLLLRTGDGGRTWTQQPNPSGQTLENAAWEADGHTVWAMGDSLTLLKSTDSGRTWLALSSLRTATPPSPTNQIMRSLQWLRPGVGVGILGGSPYRTTDGGLTWQGYLPPLMGPPRYFSTLSFWNSRNGWGMDDEMDITTDGGQTWTRPFSLIWRFRDGAMVDRYNGWMLTGGGFGHYSEKFLQTDTIFDTSVARCAGDTLTVAFTREGVFTAPEQRFRVELSNAMGRFRPTQTTVLAAVGPVAASPLRVALPANLPTGTRYRLRVIRADSSVIGADNGRGLAVYARPVVQVAPTDSVRLCAGDSVLLAAPDGFAAYVWSNGVIGQNQWVRAAGAYAVQVVQGGGCFGPFSAPVTVRVTSRPTAPAVSVSQSGNGPALLTAAPVVAGATYAWTGPSGLVAGATGPTLLLTAAAQNGEYTVRVTARGCPSLASLPVRVTVVGLAEEADAGASQVAITPNPAADQLRMSVTGSLLRHVAVTDLAGRRLTSASITTPTTETTFSVAYLPDGVYLVRVKCANGRSLTRRLVVTH